MPRQPARAATGAAGGPATAASPTNGVRNGIDVLASQGFAPLRRKKVGLITNHTGMDRDRNPTIDLLKRAGVELERCSVPNTAFAAWMRPFRWRRWPNGLPVYSLYGDTRQLAPGNWPGWTSGIRRPGRRLPVLHVHRHPGLCLEAAARQNLDFVVLDRVNPINGAAVEGRFTRHQHHFVAFHSLPLRHGMTVGELARMFDAERGWNARLTVIPVEGWRRDLWLDETGLPWVNTSPNMRSLKQAALYPGVGLLESAVSVGRGTDTPFEVIGAPYHDRRFAAELNRTGLDGIGFVPIRFTPRASVQDQECGRYT
jgi:uncharacterized protein YbbC (DUF1343 family)